MLQQLQNLQKLLFSLNCADPDKHVTQDVANLFDTILSSSSQSDTVSDSDSINKLLETSI